MEWFGIGKSSLLINFIKVNMYHLVTISIVKTLAYYNVYTTIHNLKKKLISHRFIFRGMTEKSAFMTTIYVFEIVTISRAYNSIILSLMNL